MHSKAFGGKAFVKGVSAGFLDELLNLSQANLIQLMDGEDTHAGAEALTALKGIAPGTSIWYLKAAFDHLI